MSDRNYEVLERDELGSIISIERLEDGEVFNVGDGQYGSIIKDIKEDNRYTGGAAIKVNGAWTAISAIVKG